MKQEHRKRKTPAGIQASPFPLVSSLSTAQAESYAFLFTVFSDPIRLSLLSILSQNEGQMRVEDMVACFKLSQPTISHHLRLLRDADLVEVKKVGTSAYYYLQRAKYAHIQEAFSSLLACFEPLEY